VRLAEDIVAWVLGLAIVGAVLLGVYVAIRQPVRIWRRGERSKAIFVAIGVAVGLFIFWAGGQIAP
jgi:hypothetical protein